MSQSDGKSMLKRMEFEFMSKSYYFSLNPEEYQQSEPSKATITQTKGGGFVDAFGAGLVEFSMKGTTGFKNGTKQNNNGFTKFKELRDLIRSVYEDAEVSQTPDKLKFLNYTDEEYWIVYPERFQLSRSKSRPLLYQYDIKLIGLSRITNVKPYRGKIGNPYPIKDTRVTVKDGGYTGSLIWLPVGDGLHVAQLPNNTSQVAGNLSAVVGGTNGLFSPMMSKYIVQGISVLDTGYIPNIPTHQTYFDGVEELTFKPQVSNKSVGIYKNLQDLNEEYIEINRYLPLIETHNIVNTENSDLTPKDLIFLILNKSGNSIDSTLVDAAKSEYKSINIYQNKMLKTILLDVMGLYNSIYDLDGKQSLITEYDITRIINNIKYLCASLEKSTPIPFKTIYELRTLQQNVLLFKTHMLS